MKFFLVQKYREKSSNSSKLLSEYMGQLLLRKNRSVWIAQREKEEDKRLLMMPQIRCSSSNERKSCRLF
jgi:hypothetical protein